MIKSQIFTVLSSEPEKKVKLSLVIVHDQTDPRCPMATWLDKPGKESRDFISEVILQEESGVRVSSLGFERGSVILDPDNIIIGVWLWLWFYLGLIGGLVVIG